jgi:hypothetical protein
MFAYKNIMLLNVTQCRNVSKFTDLSIGRTSLIFKALFVAAVRSPKHR